ncbi:MAG: CPBP family intramembrane metalloprotease [Maribacter sp.]|nr:CPBP family intramembrane metalloprotease [Maribacter sp.]
MEKLGNLLRTNYIVKICELLAVFLLAFIIIKLFLQPDGDNLLYNQGVLWAANIAMLLLVWLGLKLRGESWQDFGLGFKKMSFKAALRVFLLSLLVFILAVAGFIIGSIIMANITGIPESTDLTNYAYLKNNLGMLILSLIGVYIVSSFGEEVIYRAFLINRISELGMDTKKARIVAVIISAIIFGLVHYSWGPMGIVQTGCMGLVLGICYLKLKKRLWILVLAHAYMDTLLLVQLYLASN